MWRFFIAALASTALAEQTFEDSPALTALWQATNDGSTDAFISQLIQNKETGSHRASDGRGPMFWAYEFKNVDTLALLTHLGVTAGRHARISSSSRARSSREPTRQQLA